MFENFQELFPDRKGSGWQAQWKTDVVLILPRHFHTIHKEESLKAFISLLLSFIATYGYPAASTASKYLTELQTKGSSSPQLVQDLSLHHIHQELQQHSRGSWAQIMKAEQPNSAKPNYNLDEATHLRLSTF